MPLIWWLASLFSALWLLAAPPALAEVAVPPLEARVTDLTGTLSAREKSSLESTLQDFEAKKGSQIAVLLVPTTQPETVEQYAIRVAEAWKLGRKGVDDGVLLLVAKNDRKLRIEVGYGLEGVIPDAVGKRVISEVITPYFKQGDFSGGIRAGVEQLVSLVEGEPLPAPKAKSLPTAPKYDSAASNDYGDFFGFIRFVGSFGLLMLVTAAGGAFGLLGGLVSGGIVGIIVWGMWGSLAIALLSAVLTFLVVQRGSGSHSGGSWTSGGGSWSSGSGDSPSGGGFSGGGGGFGGGGASGDW